MIRSWTDTQKGYGWISIALHWASALAIVLVYALGEWGPEMLGGTRPAAIALHAGIATYSFLVFFPRIAWRVAHTGPLFTIKQPAFVAWAAPLVQFVMLSSIVALFVTGPLAVFFAGKPIDLFLFAIPSPVEANRAVRSVLGDLHEWAVNAMLVSVLMHIGGAAFHAMRGHWGIVKRMIIAVPAQKKRPPQRRPS
ncbi:MAG: cytochrome b [Hyphomicrobiaceae bacterium]|nr:cytochrome b [Hyphomicrobiaceae bacterium]